MVLARARALDIADHRQVCEIVEGAVQRAVQGRLGEEGARAAIGDDVADLARAQARMDRHEHRAGPRNGEDRDAFGDRFRQQDRDPVPRREPVAASRRPRAEAEARRSP